MILNANLANVKQLFGPEKLSGLSRNRPHAQVVQKLDSAIHSINHYLADSIIRNNAIRWIEIYSVDSTIQRLNSLRRTAVLSGALLSGEAAKTNSSLPLPAFITLRSQPKPPSYACLSLNNRGQDFRQFRFWSLEDGCGPMTSNL